MTEDGFFRLIFLIVLLLVFLIRIYFGVRQRKTGQSSWKVSEEAVEREGRWSLLLRPVSFLFMLALAVIYFVEPSNLGWLYFPLPWHVRTLGALLCTCGLPLLAWTHQTLGRQWSTTLQLKEEHKLITSGPYQFIRHPMYTSLSIIFAGLGILSSFWPFWIFVTMTIVFFTRIVRQEEEMMIERFRDEYIAFIEKTGRYFPRIGRKR